MRAKDLEQGKFYASVEYLNENEERYRRWYIILREGNNIRANVVEQINDAPLSFYAGFEVNYNDKKICFIEVSKGLFTEAVQELLTEIKSIEL